MITDKTTLAELAAIVSETLERQGIVATLSGGAAVSRLCAVSAYGTDLVLV